MDFKTIHKVKLENYFVHLIGEKSLEFGTAGSYGTEWLHLTCSGIWKEFNAVTATFENADGELTTMVMDADGFIQVPQEATAAQTDEGVLTFCGYDDDIKRISISVKYIVYEGQNVEGENTQPPAQSVFDQFVEQVGQMREDTLNARDEAQHAATSAQEYYEAAQEAKDYLENEVKPFVDESIEAIETLKEQVSIDAELARTSQEMAVEAATSVSGSVERAEECVTEAKGYADSAKEDADRAEQVAENIDDAIKEAVEGLDVAKELVDRANTTVVNADAYAQAAQQYANNAAQSATQAAQSASQAATSATNAQGYELSAASHQSEAEQAAILASSSATQAGGFANTAFNALARANDAATRAAADADEASDAAAAAKGYSDHIDNLDNQLAQRIYDATQLIEREANNALGSATAAQTSADKAKASELNAKASANDAEAQKDAAIEATQSIIDLAEELPEQFQEFRENLITVNRNSDSEYVVIDIDDGETYELVERKDIAEMEGKLASMQDDLFESSLMVDNLEDAIRTMGDQVSALNTKLSSVYKFAGSVSTYSALPTDAQSGQVYNVTDTGMNYAWTGSAWDALGTTYSNVTTTTPGLMLAEDKVKLNGIAAGAEVNVQSNWTQTNTAADDYIKNKPTNVSSFTNDAGYITSADLNYDSLADSVEAKLDYSTIATNVLSEIDAREVTY